MTTALAGTPAMAMALERLMLQLPPKHRMLLARTLAVARSLLARTLARALATARALAPMEV